MFKANYSLKKSLDKMDFFDWSVVLPKDAKKFITKIFAKTQL